MSMSTISIGLAHEFIIALVKRGLTKGMMAAIIANNEGISDEIAEIITTRLNPRLGWPIEELDLPQGMFIDLKRSGFATVRDLYEGELKGTMGRGRYEHTFLHHINEALQRHELPPIQV